MKWTEKITRFAIKNRKSPAKNRRIVGKYLSFVAVALFALFLANFAYIIAKGNIFGTDLVKEAKKVHQTTRTVPAKRGTIYCLLYTSPSPRDGLLSRMPSSA